MATFSEEQLEKRFLELKDTQDSISTLSQWCLSYPQHHKKIVTVWLQVLKKVKVEQRLTLFHLANDVIQYSKRKGFDFVESWGTALQKATTMVRDDKVKNKILRLFKIWNERSIYDEAFLVDLSGLLSSRKAAQASQDSQDFQPTHLITKIRSCKTLQDDTDAKIKVVNDNKMSLNDIDAMRSFLKDRRHGADLEQELDDGVGKLTALLSSLQAEIKDRTGLIDLLELSDAFYETQRGEAKIVCNAYRNFSKRVENLKKKLDELIETLPSPVPSPDVNAPSPSPESDIELPDDDGPGSYSTATSFIGSLVVPEHVNLTNSPDMMYSKSNSPKDSPPRKLLYKPPTPPRSYKKKSSPKVYHSPPPPTYIHSNTPTLSSSSASNYSSHSPYQPVPKPTYAPNTTSYSIPSVTYNQNTERYTPPQVYPTPADDYSSMYNPLENDEMNPYNSAGMPSPESYHIPGANPPPPPTAAYLNPPPPPPDRYSTGRNPSPQSNNYDDSVYEPTSDTYSSRKISQRRSYNDEPPIPQPHFSVPPPTADEFKPFYSTSDLTMPPLLGDDCPPAISNGLDFLEEDNEVPAQPPLLGSGGFSSFMGNLSLPFDFQKGLFTEASQETCVSPPIETIEDTQSQMEAYFSNSDDSTGGKPIEVINRTKQPDITEILKAIGMQSRSVEVELPLPSPLPIVPPPPLPPTPAEEVQSPDKNWGQPQPPLLPPKFPTWAQQDEWTDTPTSPPLYEKSGFGEPLEFEETDSLPLGDTDTDMRLPAGDVDHRNLISLTSSPRDTPWSNSQDTDYRKIVLTPKKGAQDDNVESVDMEMSDDEDSEVEQKKPPAPASLSPPIENQPLLESPLEEKEVPERRPLLSIPLSPPPKLPEPPPLPNMDDLLSDLDSDDGEMRDDLIVVPSIPSPPRPPPPPPMPIQAIQPIQSIQEVPRFPGGPRPFFPRFNNRHRFPHWQQHNNNQRQPLLPSPGQRFRPDFRGRPPRFRGNRPPRFPGW